MTPSVLRRSAIAVVALSLAAGCGSEPVKEKPAPAPEKPAPPPPKPAPVEGTVKLQGGATLYARLGGEKAITAVVDEFLQRVAADARINGRFAGANLPGLKRALIAQIGQASGGPQVYRGGTMKKVHAGMNITEAEFTALVEDLVGALDRFKVPAREKGELLAVLGPMQKDIVARPPTAEERLERVEARLVRMEARQEELLRRRESAPAQVAGTPPKPAPPPVAREKPAPWSPEEKQFSVELLKRYGTTKTAPADAPPSELVGSRLSLTRFLSSTGEVIDLKQFENDRKRVVLVILRGFTGAVCLHCSTQTVALAEQVEDFKKRNAEVILVYPGEADTVPLFLEAVKNLKEGFALPFPIVLDVDLAAVKAFMIEGALAKPTSMVIDESGTIRWAYVGKQPADRPSATDLLGVLDKLPKAPGK